MKKAKRMIISLLIILIVLSTITAVYALREFGKSPTKQELAEYEKLSYFNNGTFQSPVKLAYDFDNVSGGKIGFTRFLTKSPYSPQSPLPKVILDKNSFSKTPSDFALYWLGHSSAILELDGKRFIFDPVIENAGPLPFVVPRYDVSPINRKDLPQVDYIILTHNHYDHLERKTVQSIKSGHFIVPLGIKTLLTGWGIDKDRITELGWQESFEQDGFNITAETGVHYSNRTPFNRNKTLWNSYIIKSPSKKIFWAGDTGYGEHFHQIGKQHGPFDLAALEIDGWNTGWVNTHMFPKEVVKAAQELQTKAILPTHWAVFDLALHPWHESIDMLLEEVQDTNIKVLTPKMGEEITLESKTDHWWKTPNSTLKNN